MTQLLTKIIIAVMVPLFSIQFSPFALIAKQINKPTEPVSVSGSGIGTEENPLLVVAHRGGNTDAPENSYPAFSSAIRKNFYAAECDITRTADGRWLVTHDAEVYKHFWGFGNIEKMTFDEARKLRYSLDTNYWSYNNMTILPYEEYLDLFIDSETRPEIEIKSKGLENIDDAVRAIEERGLAEKAIVISFNYDQLQRVHELNRNIELWYLVNEITEEKISQALALDSCTALSAKGEDNSASTIKAAEDAGLEVAVWTIDSIDEAEKYYDMGVKYIVTNKLAK